MNFGGKSFSLEHWKSREPNEADHGGGGDKEET